MFKAVIIKDSIGPNNKRLISVEMAYPRFIHAEIMTHRDRARNAASSRAIPWKKPKADKTGFVANCMYQMIMTNPVIPLQFGKEQKGMQAGDALTGEEEMKAKKIWLQARDQAVDFADQLAEMGVHKSICNRLTEPFMWITVLMTATEWKNFFRLRVHPDAEIHFQKIAGMVKTAIENSIPKQLAAGEWHLPYFDDAVELPVLINQLSVGEIRPEKWAATEYAKRISAGRCARLSYLTQDGHRSFDADIDLCQRLIDRTDDVLHASPLEHVGEASDDPNLRSGPFRGWKQFRKEFKNENVEG